MSLARIALRMSAIEALRGKTLVGDNVLDSQIGALESGPDGAIRTDQELPFISVYVEGGLNEKPQRAGALHQPGETDILFEYGLTAAMAEPDPTTGVAQFFEGIPATDAAFEMMLDVIGREIINALTDPDNVWAQIFRDLYGEIAKVVRRRTSDAATGTRIAAHQLIITVNLTQEPLRGIPRAPTCAYRRFLEALEAHEDPTKQAAAVQLRALIEGGAATDYATWRRMLGLSKPDAELLGKGEGQWPSEIMAVIDSPYAPEVPRE